jgi:hypothetical protein
MPYILQMNTSASLSAGCTLRSALGKLSHFLLSNGQKDEECDARDDAIKNYSWYQNDFFINYLTSESNKQDYCSLLSFGKPVSIS